MIKFNIPSLLLFLILSVPSICNAVDPLFTTTFVNPVGKVPGTVAPCAGQGLLTFLGPIGKAYRVGKAGAWAIKAYGDSNASKIERSFACSQLKDLWDAKQKAFYASNTAKANFQLRFCPIKASPDIDSCNAPTGIDTFEPDRACGDIDATCKDDTDAEDLFRAAGDAYSHFLAKSRLYLYYYHTCNPSTKPHGCNW